MNFFLVTLELILICDFETFYIISMLKVLIQPLVDKSHSHVNLVSVF